MAGPGSSSGVPCKTQRIRLREITGPCEKALSAPVGRSHNPAMLAVLSMLASTICLPPAGSGTCVPAGSSSGIAAVTMLALGLLGLVGAATLILARYQRGERDIPALLARPIQPLVCAGVTCLIGIAILAMVLPAR
jgi:hypothetical protein